MSQSVKIASRKDVPEGQIKTVEANGRKIALANAGGRFYAVDNTCVHRGGPLGEGTLEGSQVTCPWHGWTFDLATGKCTFNPAAQVRCFPVSLQGEDVLVEI